MQAPRFLFIAALFASSLTAQVPQQQTSPSHPADANVLQTGIQLVVVDVVVQDINGHPVHGLKREDFILTEDKRPEKLSFFDEHTNLNPAAPGPAMPAMPAGTFTNYTPTPPEGALNVLLLDSLNTPMADQSYVRLQLQNYVNKARPGTRIAIFGLSRQLYMLQGFSSDPAVLKAAVDHKISPTASPLLADPAGSGDTVPDLADLMSSSGVTSSLAAFEAEISSDLLEQQITLTLDAFNMLGHYLSAFPGRKNLIWFSGSFPIDILPNDSLGQDAFSVVQDNEAKYRETTNLLSQAQVAVYPVDARGLMTQPTFAASTSGHGMQKPGAIGKSVSAASDALADEHITMRALADDTGGEAFYNNNDLSTAVSNAIENGANYYTLNYSSDNKKQNGDYRTIHVALAPNLEASKYKLAYRRGYYADDPAHPYNEAAAVASSVAKGATYAQASMARGAPTPVDILFKVRVLPASTATEDTVAPGNDTDPAKPLKGPFRRYLIDYVALANAIQVTKTPDNHYTGAVEFKTYLYNNNGQLLNAAGKTINFNLTEDQYKHFLNGIAAHLEISAPVKGDNYLRIGIHDVSSNRFGAVEVAVAPLSKLAPPPAPPPPPDAAPPATAMPSAATP